MKIKNVEKHAIVTELGTAVFVGSAQMILKLGIATVALVGGHLFAKEEIDVLTFFMFLLVVSRIYDPMRYVQNLAATLLRMCRVQDWMRFCRMRYRKVQQPRIMRDMILSFRMLDFLIIQEMWY